MNFTTCTCTFPVLSVLPLKLPLSLLRQQERNKFSTTSHLFIHLKFKRMKKILFTIAFLTITLMANAFETCYFSVNFNKMELNQNGEVYELVEVSNKELVSGRVVTYYCIDKDLRAVAFKLLVSEKGKFLRYKRYCLG